MQTKDFQQFVWDFYKKNRRDFEWRQTADPYAILVSEMMLQQTQTLRVVPKFREWMRLFTDVRRLAAAALPDVLAAWSGLGYNRRAKYLWMTAQKVMTDFGGHIPSTEKELRTLPGIGEYSARAILAFAFGQPVIFVETNIRTAIIHHFFADSEVVSDAQIKEVLASLLPDHNIRDWYYALMDYGSFLKNSGVDYFAKIKGHAPQSKFKGSKRFVRGWIMKRLSQLHANGAPAELSLPLKFPGYSQKVISEIIDGLVKEGFVVKKEKVLQLPS